MTESLIVDDATTEGEESPAITNNHSNIDAKHRPAGSNHLPVFNPPSYWVNTIGNTVSHGIDCNKGYSCGTSHAAKNRYVVTWMRLLLMVLCMVQMATCVLETSGVRYINGPIGKRLVRDRRVIARDANAHRSLSLSITCDRPPGASADAWCVAAGFEIASPCAADFVQSGFTDFANFRVCRYNAIAQAGWLPGCSGDMEVTLYATCFQT